MQGIVLHVLVYIIYIALPIWCALWFWRGKARDKLDVLARLWGLPLYFAWAYFLAPWDWVPYYSRYALPVLLTLVLIQSWRVLGKVPLIKRKPFKSWIAKSLWGMAGLFFLATVFPVLISSEPIETAVDLKFPLKDGTFYVAQGGNSAGLNNHALVTPQKFALDIAKLGPWSSRANHPFPRQNAQFSIYGQPVFSPCEGHAIRVRDGLKDTQPLDFGALEALSEQDIAGNHVVVRCKGVDLLLAHFKPGTIPLREGQPVAEGEFIGRAGNSGNTSEPHLHLHAQKMSEDLSFWSEKNASVPIRFEGRFLQRNDLVRKDP